MPSAVAPTLAALWLLTFASTSQVMLISPLLPQISDELDVPPALGGALIGAYGAAAALAALITGPVSDRYGRRPLLLIGAGLMAAALWGHAIATTFGGLLVLRGLAGAGGGVLGGSAIAYVGDAFPYERRGWANGWVVSGFALGHVLGIPIGTIVGARWGFRVPFLGFAAVLTVAFVLIILVVPRPPVPLSSELGLVSALRKYVALIRSPRTRGMLAMYPLMFAGVSLYVTYLPSWLEATFGANGDQVATMFFVGGIAATLTTPFAGRISDRIGRKGPILAACVLFASCAAATPYVIRSLAWSYPVFFIAMVATSIRTPPTQSLASALVSSEQRGSLLSLGSALGQAGFALGAALAGGLYPIGGYPSCSWTAAAIIVITAVIVALFVPEPER